MGLVAAGRLPGSQLSLSNPLVLETLAELERMTAYAPQVREAGVALATALHLDGPEAPRVTVSVAARAVTEATARPQHEVRGLLNHAATRDPLLGIVCQALAGHDLGGRARPSPERDAVERGLYLVARMAEEQEQIDALEGSIATDGDAGEGR